MAKKTTMSTTTTRGGLSKEESDLVDRCWQFANTLDANEQLPRPAGATTYSALEAYLVLLHAHNQAGLYRFSTLTRGAAGMHLLFPTTRHKALNQLSQEEWEAFVLEINALRQKLMRF